MKDLTLRDGSVCIVDDEDFDLVSTYKWYRSSQGYVQRAGDQHHLSRLVTNCGPFQQVRYRDKNKLNCTKQNLAVRGFVGKTTQELNPVEKFL